MMMILISRRERISGIKGRKELMMMSLIIRREGISGIKESSTIIKINRIEKDKVYQESRNHLKNVRK